MLIVIELLFLSLTVELLQSKTCQNSLLSGGVGQFEPNFPGGSGRLSGSSLVDGNAFGYLSVKTASSCVQSF